MLARCAKKGREQQIAARGAPQNTPNQLLFPTQFFCPFFPDQGTRLFVSVLCGGPPSPHTPHATPDTRILHFVGSFCQFFIVCISSVIFNFGGSAR